MFSVTHVTSLCFPAAAFPDLRAYIYIILGNKVLNFNIVEMVNIPFMVCAFCLWFKTPSLP